MYPLVRVSKNVLIRLQTGAGGYNTVIWRKSPVIEWLRTHTLDGQIYSNVADVIYFLTGTNAKMSPNRSDDISQFIKSLPSEVNKYLVWFNTEQNREIYDLQELASVIEIEQMAILPDGAIYLFK
jgi:hypothetical protein